MCEFNQHHAKEVTIWKRTSLEKAGILTHDFIATKLDTVKISIERRLAQARFDKHMRAPLNLFKAIEKRKVTLTSSMAKLGSY